MSREREGEREGEREEGRKMLSSFFFNQLKLEFLFADWKV